MFVAIALAAALAASASMKFPDTPLFDGVTKADFETGEQLVRSRVEQRFAVGRSEVGLEDYLRSQGLKTRRSTASLAPGTPIYGQSEARQGPGPCERVVLINWRADSQQIIRELVVNYQGTGCP